MNKQQQGNNNNKNPAEKHKPTAEEKIQQQSCYSRLSKMSNF